MSSHHVLHRDFPAIIMGLRVIVRLIYFTGDPFAVTMKIGGMPKDRVWQFARDLLKDGGGEGDIRIEKGIDKIVIKLSNNNGKAAIFLDRDDVDSFVEMMYRMVKPDQESDRIDWDAELAELTSEE